LASAGLSPSDIDLIIVATITADMPWPAAACQLQQRLGTRLVPGFDLSAGCTGFIYGLWMADQVIRAGGANHVLVVGADCLSRVVDWQDRATCVLFGDGAGAAVVSKSGNDEGFLSFTLGADGSGAPLVCLPGGGSQNPASHETVDKRLHYIKMNGAEVFRFAVRIMGEAAVKALELAGISSEEVACFVPHQANYRIIQAAAKRIGIPMEKVFVNVEKYGNTSAASIPIALYEARREGRINPGDTLVLVGFGAGLTWGASVLRWTMPNG
jgi:3-oxoacyl-[acyl-carrier-protein] synthase-3